VARHAVDAARVRRRRGRHEWYGNLLTALKM
jgi:hypothetical protein